MAKAAYPTIGIAALVMFGIVYFIGCLRLSGMGLKYKHTNHGNYYWVAIQGTALQSTDNQMK